MAGVSEVGSLLPTFTLQICKVLNLGIIPHRIFISIIPQALVVMGLVSNQCQHHFLHDYCIQAFAFCFSCVAHWPTSSNGSLIKCVKSPSTRGLLELVHINNL